MFNEKLKFFLLVFVSVAGFGARPLSVDDAKVVEKGIYEVELGYDFSNTGNDIGNRSIGLSIKHGITERFDFGIGIPYNIEPDDGLSDVEFAMKLALFNRKILAGSFVVGYVPGESGYTAVGILSVQAGPVVTHINLGYTALPELREDVAVYGVAVEYPLSDKITLVSELTGELKKGPIEALIGGSFLAFNVLAIDLGIGCGLTEESSEIKFTLGLTYGF
ncbi:MAG: hypothetical protein ABIN61_02380 [candidate division WOR-3 bacterium]